MSARFFNPAPVFMDLLALQPLAGGSLQFYAQGTTTPKLTYADSAASIPNPNPIPLDSAGRASVNIWLDGAYTVRLLDNQGATIWTRDVDDGAQGGATIPSLVTGQFLTNDGSNLIWQLVREVPDPTGSSGMILGTDGSNLIWQAPPTIPDLPLENFANRVILGTLMIQWGTATAPATGNRQVAVSQNFPNPFSGEPHMINVIPRNTTHTSGGQIGVPAIIAKSATGFSVQFDTDDFGQTNAQLTGPLPFDWMAIGPVAAS